MSVYREFWKPLGKPCKKLVPRLRFMQDYCTYRSPISSRAFAYPPQIGCEPGHHGYPIQDGGFRRDTSNRQRPASPQDASGEERRLTPPSAERTVGRPTLLAFAHATRICTHYSHLHPRCRGSKASRERHFTGPEIARRCRFGCSLDITSPYLHQWHTL